MIIESLEKDLKQSFIKVEDEVFDVVDGFANVTKEVADHLTSFPGWEVAKEVPEKVLKELSEDKPKKDDKKPKAEKKDGKKDDKKSEK